MRPSREARPAALERREDEDGPHGEDDRADDRQVLLPGLPAGEEVQPSPWSMNAKAIPAAETWGSATPQNTSRRRTK